MRFCVSAQRASLLLAGIAVDTVPVQVVKAVVRFLRFRFRFRQ